MEKLNFGNALVVGKRNPKVNEVERILGKYFLNVDRISGLNDKLDSYASGHFNLIVVTDSLDHKPDRAFVANLRKKFPKAKVLGLFDKINQGIEVSLRSVGLIFLGSYDLFNKNSFNIFQSAFKGERP